jgi:hypothetical protein
MRNPFVDTTRQAGTPPTSPRSAPHATFVAPGCVVDPAHRQRSRPGPGRGSVTRVAGERPGTVDDPAHRHPGAPVPWFDARETASRQQTKPLTAPFVGARRRRCAGSRGGGRAWRARIGGRLRRSVRLGRGFGLGGVACARRRGRDEGRGRVEARGAGSSPIHRGVKWEVLRPMGLTQRLEEFPAALRGGRLEGSGTT